MSGRIAGMVAIAAFTIAGLLGAPRSLAQNAYITNNHSGTVSVINTRTNTVTATIPIGIGSAPEGVAITRDGSKVYITNANSTVSVINAATNDVTTVRR